MCFLIHDTDTMHTFLTHFSTGSRKILNSTNSKSSMEKPTAENHHLSKHDSEEECRDRSQWSFSSLACRDLKFPMVC